MLSNCLEIKIKSVTQSFDFLQRRKRIQESNSEYLIRRAYLNSIRKHTIRFFADYFDEFFYCIKFPNGTSRFYKNKTKINDTPFSGCQARQPIAFRPLGSLTTQIRFRWLFRSGEGISRCTAPGTTAQLSNLR